jgi:hypothetical protein
MPYPEVGIHLRLLITTYTNCSSKTCSNSEFKFLGENESSQKAKTMPVHFYIPRI